MPKRKVIRTKAKSDGNKSKTKRVSKKDGTVKIKTKTKWEDGSKSKSKVEISKGGKVTTTLKTKPPKGTARKAKKAGKKSAKAMGKALKSMKPHGTPSKPKAKGRINPKGAALGAMGGSASSTPPNQITRRPIQRKTTRGIAAAPLTPPMPPILRKTAKKARR